MRPVRTALLRGLLAALVLAPQTARAQQPAPCADLQAKVDSLQATLRRLQTQISQLQESLAQASAQPSAAVKPSPVVQGPASPTTTTAAPRTTASRCVAITKKGTRCSRKASAGSTYCWQHQK